MYQIQQGDTLSALARDNGTTVAELMKLNKQIEHPDYIYAGKTLNLGTPITRAQQPTSYSSPQKETVSAFTDPTHVDKKLSQIESGGDYNAVNPTSGAYGKYQFMPEVAKEISGILGIKGDRWKAKGNQDRMYEYLKKRNGKELQRYGLAPTIANIYGAWQQGPKGYNEIVKGEKLSPARTKNMQSNVLGDNKHLVGNELRAAWLARLAKLTNKV